MVKGGVSYKGGACLHVNEDKGRWNAHTMLVHPHIRNRKGSVKPKEQINETLKSGGSKENEERREINLECCWIVHGEICVVHEVRVWWENNGEIWRLIAEPTEHCMLHFSLYDMHHMTD